MHQTLGTLHVQVSPDATYAEQLIVGAPAETGYLLPGGGHDAVKRDAQIAVALRRQNDCLTDPYRGTEWCHRLGQKDEKFRLLGVELEPVCPNPL